MTNWEKMRDEAAEKYADFNESSLREIKSRSNRLADKAAFIVGSEYAEQCTPLSILKEKNPHVKRLVENLEKIILSQQIKLSAKEIDEEIIRLVDKVKRVKGDGLP